MTKIDEKKVFCPIRDLNPGPIEYEQKVLPLSYRDIHTYMRLDVINKVHEKVASGSSSSFQQKLRYTPCLAC